MNRNRIIAIGMTCLFPMVIWAVIASYAADTWQGFGLCVIAALGGGITIAYVYLNGISGVGITAAIALNLVLPSVIIGLDEDPSAVGATPTTGATPPPAPPQVPTDIEVKDYLRDSLQVAEGWQLLPVVTNPLVQPETVLPSVAYNAVQDGVLLTPIDLSLYEGAQLRAKMLSPEAEPINFRCEGEEIKDLYYYPGVRRFSLEVTDGSVQLLQKAELKDETVLVQFTVKPLATHSVWFKTELVTNGTSSDPKLAPGHVRWGKIPLSLNGKSLQRVVMQVEVRQSDMEGMLLTESILQKMSTPPGVVISGSSGRPDQQKPINFGATGRERFATDEALCTDEFYTVDVRTPTDRQLRWRISVRCDWPAGT